MVKIIYEDQDILVAEKPVGMESQSSRRFEPDMVSEIKKHLSTKLSTNSSTRRTEPYVGVIHRLDKPVGGIMVYAKNQKAAASLSKQVQGSQMKKTYQAVVCGKLVDNVGNYVDYLLKDGKTNYSRVVDKKTADSKRAELNYRVESTSKGEEPLTLVQIELLTGRHHQIRVQFASRQNPLWGDNKYNPRWGGTLPMEAQGKKPAAAGEGDKLGNTPHSKEAGGLALWAARLSFYHPATDQYMEFSVEPKGEIFTLF